MPYQLDVKRTLNKIPLDGVQEIVAICAMDDGSLKIVSTADEDNTADIILDAAVVYDLVEDEVEVTLANDG